MLINSFNLTMGRTKWETANLQITIRATTYKTNTDMDTTYAINLDEMKSELRTRVSLASCFTYTFHR